MVRALCIGAGPEQVPAILKARDLGLRVLALDGNPDAPGLSMADDGQVIDISDEEAVVGAAMACGISLVLPAPVGRYLTSVGAVNDRLGLRGISRRAAANCADKVAFRRCLRGLGLRQPAQLRVASDGELAAAARRVGYPCVLKPRFGSGSRGVVVLQDEGGARQGVQRHLLGRGKQTETIIEEFISGDPVGVDGAVVNGRLTLTCIREKSMTPMPYRVEVAYAAPARLHGCSRERVRRVVELSAKAVGLENCLLHADLVVSDGPVVIEMAGRPSGLGISSRMVPLSTGTDFLGNGIRMALGQAVRFGARRARPVVMHFLSVPAGRVVRLPVPGQVRRDKRVVDYSCSMKLGDVVPEITSAADCLGRGFVMTVGETLEEAFGVARRVLGRVEIEPEEANSEPG